MKHLLTISVLAIAIIIPAMSTAATSVAPVPVTIGLTNDTMYCAYFAVLQDPGTGGHWTLVTQPGGLPLSIDKGRAIKVSVIGNYGGRIMVRATASAVCGGKSVGSTQIIEPFGTEKVGLFTLRSKGPNFHFTYQRF